MSNKKSSQKQVTVIARYLIKRSGSVVYLIRNGEDKKYCVTINQSGRPGCVEYETSQPCKGNAYGKQCYHVARCQELEAARTPKPVEPVVETEVKASQPSQYQPQATLIERASSKVQRTATARVVAKLVSSGGTPGSLMAQPSVPTFGQMNAPQPLNVNRAVLMR